MSNPTEDWNALVEEQERRLIAQMKSLSVKTSAGDSSSAAAAMTISEKRQGIEPRECLIVSKLPTSTSDDEMQRRDFRPPILDSAHRFGNLNLKPELVKAFYAMRFNKHSKIQGTVLKVLIADPPRNVIVKSPSNFEKSVYLALTILSRVDPSENYPQAIYLAPTFELAMQTAKVFRQVLQYCTAIQFRLAVPGGDDVWDRLTEHVIIGTPGKVMDWGLKLRLFDINKIRVLCLDEADLLLDTQGHQDQSIRIYEMLPAGCQLMLFSPGYDRELLAIIERIISNPLLIEIAAEENDSIKQYHHVECPTVGDEYIALDKVYSILERTIGLAVILCQTRNTAKWLVEKMSKYCHAAALLSEDQNSDQRCAVLDRVRDGKEKILVATETIIRGIFLEQVNAVINFDTIEAVGKYK